MSIIEQLAVLPDGPDRPPVTPAESPSRRREPLWRRMFAAVGSDRLQRGAVAAWMNVLIIGTAVITAGTAGFLTADEYPVAEAWAPEVLKLFVLWCLAFLPGWLYIRFLRMRAKALWNEYVLTLHRLGWDRPEFLPEPPANSEFHQRWLERRGDTVDTAENIYRQKFEAFYGRQVTDNAGGDQQVDGADFVVRSESLFPIFLATAVFSTGWAAVLWDTGFLTEPDQVWDVLKYGFLGAYAFAVSMLVRRFFQSDLRPSAYASVVLRIVLVLLLVAVLHQVLPTSSPAFERGHLALAFLVGFFPLVGLSFLQQLVSRLFGGIVPSLNSEYPLDQLDGFSIWYESRLLEEGVEDMQNLATMNLVDVVLHTRVPPGRLIDWIDQAFLYIHLAAATRADLDLARNGDRKAQRSGQPPMVPAAGARARIALRGFGIRTATDLLKALPVGSSTPDPTRAPNDRGDSLSVPAGLTSDALTTEQLQLLVTVLRAEPGLTPVWNWQRHGVEEYRRSDAGQQTVHSPTRS